MFSVTSRPQDTARAYKLLRTGLSQGSKEERRTLAWPGPGKNIDNARLWRQPDNRLWTYLSHDTIEKRYHCWFGQSVSTTTIQTPTIEINFDERQVQRYLTGRLVIDESHNLYLAHKGELKGGRRSVVTADRFENAIKGFSKHEVTWPDGRIERLFVIGAIEKPSFVKRLTRFVSEAHRLKKAAIEGNLPDAEQKHPGYKPGSSGKSKGKRSSDFEIDRWHHVVVNCLHDALKVAGIETFSSKHNEMAPDLYSKTKSKHLRHLFEIKTGQDTSSLYTAIGQLIVYGADQPSPPQRILVVENPIDDANFERALKQQKIFVLNFTRTGPESFEFPELRRALAT
jgi:hypothetical protein